MYYTVDLISNVAKMD